MTRYGKLTPILKTEKLTHTYSAGTPFEMTAISGIDFEVFPGEFIGLIGHTGSGKSTFIQHLNGLIKPTSGKVLFDGADIHSSKEMTRSVRFKVGLVFQYPEYQLFEETVYKDIAFGPKNMKLSPDEVDERVRQAARLTGLADDLLERSPFELSGGQKRRVAIAGVIAMRPQVLILDEPTAGLDPRGCDEILSNIKDYHAETGAAVIMVTHSMEEAAQNADRMAVLYKGGIALQGTPREVFSHGGKLRGMGLDLPQITQVAMRLRALGVPVDGSVYTVSDAAKAIAALKGGAKDA